MNNHESQQLLNQFNEAQEKYRNACRKLSEYEPIYRNLDNVTKTVLADVFMKKRMDDTSQDKKTLKEAEMEALASDEYKAHLNAVNEAHKEYLQAKASKEACQTFFDYCQSRLSYEKERMKII